MKVRARLFAVTSIVSLVAGCDALIGLGEEPSGSAPSSSASTGDGTSASTADATSSSTGDVTSVGGADVASASTASGTGGDGGGGSGQGGSGGAPPDSPCGPCDASCEDCADGPTCKLREYPPIPMYARGDDVGSVLNRLGRGLAVTEDVITFWAYEDDVGDPTLFVVDRVTEAVETVPLPGGFVSLGASETGRVLLADSQSGLRALQRGTNDRGWELMDLDHTIPSTGAVAGGATRFVLAHNNNGQAFVIDPDSAPDAENPCPLNARELGTAPIDARVRLLGGGPTALLLGLLPVNDAEGVPYSLSVMGACNTSPSERRTLPEIEYGMAFDAIGSRRYIKGLPDPNSSDAILVYLDADGAIQVTALTNRSRALAARTSGVLFPRLEGGLDRCDLDLSGCAPVLTQSQIGQVHAIEARPSGFVALGHRGSANAAGEARLVCVDDGP